MLIDEMLFAHSCGCCDLLNASLEKYGPHNMTEQDRLVIETTSKKKNLKPHDVTVRAFSGPTQAKVVKNGATIIRESFPISKVVNSIVNLKAFVTRWKTIAEEEEQQCFEAAQNPQFKRNTGMYCIGSKLLFTILPCLFSKWIGVGRNRRAVEASFFG
jgi:hypothetical protein